MDVAEQRCMAHLQGMLRDYPDTPKLTDRFRADRGRGIPDWPHWCFLPMAGSYAIVSDRHATPVIPLEFAGDIARVAALNAWRFSRGVYRFHADLQAALWASPLSGDVPIDVLYRLPEWCVYIETPGAHDATMHGFYAHLEHDANDGRAELRLLLDTTTGLQALPVHLGGWSVAEAIDQMIAEGQRQAVRHAFVAPVGDMEESARYGTGCARAALSLLLYLCSEDPEIAHPTKLNTRPYRTSPTRQGWRLFPPQQIITWQIGGTIGPQLGPTATGLWAGTTSATGRYHYRWLSSEGAL